jgi:hypothetical protein
MKKTLSILLGFILIFSLGLASIILVQPARAAATTYVFATFRGDAAADEKLWIYTSSDGVNFSLYANTGFGGPTGVLRDPSIMKYSDGKYYIGFTIQSWTTASTSFAVASSPDLKTWTTIATVPSGIANTHFTWAPDWYIEGSTYRLIVSVDDSGNGSNFKTYAYTALNTSFTSWSGPTYIGIAGNYIDTFIVKVGSTYHALSKGPTWIEHATATSLTGPWTFIGTGNWAGWGSGLEAPGFVLLDNGTWRTYADAFASGGGIKTGTANASLTTFSGLTSIGVSPAGTLRHGSVWRDTSFNAGPTPTRAPTPVYYRITNRNSGKVMDVQNPNTSDGAKVGQYTWSGANWQQWQFVDKGSGYFNIVSRNSGKCLDVTSASTADGASIIQYTCGSGANQQFQWVATGSYFNIKARHSGKCINVVGSSTADAALLEQRACGTGNSFQWTRQ